MASSGNFLNRLFVQICPFLFEQLLEKSSPKRNGYLFNNLIVARKKQNRRRNCRFV
nr:MAG TPA: hypothetical protein [Caudoviricetes sp.]